MCEIAKKGLVGGTGLETKSVTPDKNKYLRDFSNRGAAKCAAVCVNTPIDADLQRIIDAWPKLSDAVRQLIINVLNVENQLTKSY